MDGEQHSRLVGGRRQHFSTARLWRLAEGSARGEQFVGNPEPAYVDP